MLDLMFFSFSVSTWCKMFILWFKNSISSFVNVLMIALLASVAKSASGSLISEFLYSFIIKLLYVLLLLVMLFKCSKNNIIRDINLFYTIKNPVSVDQWRKVTLQKEQISNILSILIEIDWVINCLSLILRSPCNLLIQAIILCKKGDKRMLSMSYWPQC